MNEPIARIASPSMRNVVRPVLLACMVALSGCTTFKPPQISYDDDVPPLPSPPSLAEDRPRSAARSAVLDASQGRQEGRRRRPKEPVARIETANDAARVEPRKEGYFNAVQVFPFSPGALYQIYAAPRTDHRYRARARRAAHGFRAGIGRRHRALGRRRHRKRKWRHQTRPHHGQADAAFDRDQPRRQHRPAHLSDRAALA